ncbi:hypothetical protein [Streptomyces sp. NPDC088812]|uniref:hypothetical protein n=1 Tax=Streptomyces sp. NPDC088812 TaxID=3365905 RepID=UPI003824954A
MARARGSWTGGSLTAGSFLKPHRVARAVFHPVWIPAALDPTVERLKRIRVVAGVVAALGVYSFIEGGFAFDEMLDNAVTASAVLFLLTPLTVGVMLLVWRRTGAVSQLRTPLVNSLKLLLLFVASVVMTLVLFRLGDTLGAVARLVSTLLGLWAAFFVVAGAIRLTGNFFGTAAVHRCLPPLLATVTTWLMAVPDLVTGDLHGLGLTLGVVFILGAPVTVTAIALLETRRLGRRYGIRLTAHPATLPPVPAPPPPASPTPPAPMRPTAPPSVPRQGQPYGPYSHPYGSSGPHNGRNPYGR